MNITHILCILITIVILFYVIFCRGKYIARKNNSIPNTVQEKHMTLNGTNFTSRHLVNGNTVYICLIQDAHNNPKYSMQNYFENFMTVFNQTYSFNKNMTKKWVFKVSYKDGPTIEYFYNEVDEELVPSSKSGIVEGYPDFERLIPD